MNARLLPQFIISSATVDFRSPLLIIRVRIVNDIKIVRVGGRADQNCTMRGKQGDERGVESGRRYQAQRSPCWLHQYIQAAMHMVEGWRGCSYYYKGAAPWATMMPLVWALTTVKGEMSVHHLTHLLPRLLSSSASTP